MVNSKQSSNNEKILGINRTYICIIISLCGFFTGLLFQMAKDMPLKNNLSYKIENNSAAIKRMQANEMALRADIYSKLEKLDVKTEGIKDGVYSQSLKIERLIVQISNLSQRVKK